MYLLSLVVPVYGVEKYIEQFARSAFSQDCGGVQFVFVDDGSPDRSMDILQSVIDSEFPHLKEDIVIVHKQNEGLPMARKTGIENASGEYILCADSDDWLYDGALNKLLSVISETKADMVYFDLMQEFGDHCEPKVELDYDASSKRDFIINLYNYKSHGYVWSKCFRRSLYTDNTIYTPIYGMHEDIYLMSQIIFYAESFAHIKEPLYHYRRDNEASILHQPRKKRDYDSDRNFMNLYEHFRGKTANSPVQDVWGGIVMRSGWHSINRNWNFFREYPYLAEDILAAPLSKRYRIKMLGQYYMKIYSWFYTLAR